MVIMPIHEGCMHVHDMRGVHVYEGCAMYALYMRGIQKKKPRLLQSGSLASQ